MDDENFYNLVIDYFRKSNKVKNIRSTDDFNIFDILNNGAKSQEEEMIRKRIYSDLNLLIDLLPIDQRMSSSIDILKISLLKKLLN